MNELAARQMLEIGKLERELQEQKGMLWVLGEIIKVANNIGSFKDLMQVMTDMLMGVTGVNACCLWIGHDEVTKVYLRSTEFNNDFLELGESSIHSSMKELKETYLYKLEEIYFPIIEGANIPKSRLFVPLCDFNKNIVIGGLVLEHEQEYFFTATNTVFFETLATFIASNAKNSKLFERVSEESETDPLTGVYNRRHLNKMIDGCINQYNHLTVGVFDTDNFKFVNDFLGHIKGDEVLQALAVAAQNFIKTYDGKIVRYGGDEFVLLIPRPLKQAMDILQRFQQIVAQLPIIKAMSIPVTITVGVCAYPDMTLDKSSLVKVADTALLRGKDEGKNCIKIASKEDFYKIQDRE